MMMIYRGVYDTAQPYNHFSIADNKKTSTLNE